MTTDHSKQRYCAARPLGADYRGIVYHYDPTGNHAIVVWQSKATYDTREKAIDAAGQWAEDNGIEAEME